GLRHARWPLQLADGQLALAHQPFQQPPTGRVGERLEQLVGTRHGLLITDRLSVGQAINCRMVMKIVPLSAVQEVGRSLAVPARRGPSMDKAALSLLGVVSGLPRGGGTAHAADLRVAPAKSFAELLAPIDNAVARLRVSDAARGAQGDQDPPQPRD